MCFSITADLVVGTALVPVAVATLREVKHWREVPFALLPTVWCIYAATLSVLALVHMVRRRRLSDPHRYHGVAADRVTSNA